VTSVDFSTYLCYNCINSFHYTPQEKKMSNEENAPSSPPRVDPEAFQRAARERNSKVLRKQRLRTSAIIVLGLVGVAVCTLAIIWTTEWLIASRNALAHPSDRPEYLIVLTAIIGAILIVGGALAALRIATSITMATHEFVGFSSWSVLRTIFVTTGIALAFVTVVVVYLAVVFYS
jgi:hypothetical protein